MCLLAINSEWISFLGAIIGGILGGILTLGGVIITIFYQKKENKKMEQKVENKEINNSLYNIYKELTLFTNDAYNKYISKLDNIILKKTLSHDENLYWKSIIGSFIENLFVFYGSSYLKNVNLFLLIHDIKNFYCWNCKKEYQVKNILDYNDYFQNECVYYFKKIMQQEEFELSALKIFDLIQSTSYKLYFEKEEKLIKKILYIQFCSYCAIKSLKSESGYVPKSFE